MSFLNIKNHEERDKIIKDYLALKERLKKRNMEERSDLADYQRDLEEKFEPVVASNKEMVKEIINELTPIAKELQELNNKAARPKLVATSKIGIKRDIDSQPKSKHRLTDNLGPNAETFIANYLNPDTRNNQVDTTFGIRYENGPWMIGNKQIKIEGDDIKIEGEIYEGTPGLWSLITSKTPKNYTEDDLARYKELLHETSAMHQHYDPRDPYPRASGGKKLKQILAPIWNEFQMTGVVASRNDNDDDVDSLDGTVVNENNDESDSGDIFQSASEGERSQGDGIKMYLQKHGRCFGLDKCGNGLKFTPRPKLAGIQGDGLYIRVGSRVYHGQGLILGSKSPFRNIPILGWLL